MGWRSTRRSVSMRTTAGPTVSTAAVTKEVFCRLPLLTGAGRGGSAVAGPSPCCGCSAYSRCRSLSGICSRNLAGIFIFGIRISGSRPEMSGMRIPVSPRGAADAGEIGIGTTISSATMKTTSEFPARRTERHKLLWNPPPWCTATGALKDSRTGGCFRESSSVSCGGAATRAYSKATGDDATAASADRSSCAVSRIPTSSRATRLGVFRHVSFSVRQETVLVQRMLVTADLPSWDLQLRSDPPSYAFGATF